ncbi:MAG TPA: super-infection exclusion protein B [Candidatus Angelobacter sp.]|nr:super-infection exclusion protein B [Candidatus Angelobacter sp.]
MTTPIPTGGDVLKALEKIFLSPRVSVTVFFVCLSLLLFGNWIAALAPLAQHYSGLIWFFMLISGFYTLTFPGQWAWNSFSERRKRRKERLRWIGRLHSLTVDEKHILQVHLEEANGVETWSLNRVEIQALGQSGILRIMTTRGSIGYLKLPEEMQAYLKSKPELVATPGNPRPERSENEWMI